jgi:hypothetical protein
VIRELLLITTACAASAGVLSNGDRVCAECHREQAARFSATPMARALESAAASDILKRHPDLAFREGQYESRIRREGDRSILTVTRGTESISVPLLWAFGRGQAGQTYVFERNGSLYESRVSFFNGTGTLDLTMGAQGTTPATIDEAAGRRMEATDARDCFACHSTGAVAQLKLHLESMSPGLSCESCHGSAAKHVAAVRTGDAAGAKMPRLSTLAAEEMSDLCGRCHRTWSQIALNGPRGINNVRFQPYRLTNSKCYDASDTRIRCTACHDPHGPVETRAANYDSKCAACHLAKSTGKICRVAKQNCTTCHMPKLELPGSHARFTDHQIRIARANAPYPN